MSSSHLLVLRNRLILPPQTISQKKIFQILITTKNFIIISLHLFNLWKGPLLGVPTTSLKSQEPGGCEKHGTGRCGVT